MSEYVSFTIGDDPDSVSHKIIKTIATDAMKTSSPNAESGKPSTLSPRI